MLTSFTKPSVLRRSSDDAGKSGVGDVLERGGELLGRVVAESQQRDAEFLPALVLRPEIQEWRERSGGTKAEGMTAGEQVHNIRTKSKIVSRAMERLPEAPALDPP